MFFELSVITLFYCGIVGQICCCQETDNVNPTCEKMSATNNECENWSVVLYEESSLLPIHKQERRFNFVDHDIIIKQDWSNLGVAAVVWDAVGGYESLKQQAEVLCEYLEHNPHLVKEKNIIELGAGTGVVGIVAALLGGFVKITDRELVMDFLQSTVEQNLPLDIVRQTKVQVLDWTEIDNADYGTYDVILGADIVYIKEIFEDLLKTLIKLSNEDTLILLSCRIRYERDTNFLSRLETHFNVEKILYDSVKDVNLYRVIKR